MKDSDPSYLSSTSIIDSDHPAVIGYARSVAGPSRSPVKAAVRLFYAVRDHIRYDPYVPFYRPEHYRSSYVLHAQRGFCISKAGLLCALARALSIPARIGFATVRNHLASRELIEFLGSDRFVYHGYTEMFLEGRWVKATPAFNVELCERFGSAPLDFNGRQDAMLQPYNSEAAPFMEYLEEHGTSADIPVDRIVSAWENAYGRDRVQGWILEMERSGGSLNRDMMLEAVYRPTN